MLIVKKKKQEPDSRGENFYPFFKAALLINNPFVVRRLHYLLRAHQKSSTKGTIRITCLISINKLNIMRFDAETSFTRLSFISSLFGPFKPFTKGRGSNLTKGCPRSKELSNFSFRKVTKGLESDKFGGN